MKRKRKGRLRSQEPEFTGFQQAASGFFTATFRPNPDVRDQVTGEVTPEVTGQAEAHDEAHYEAHEPMTEIELKLLAACAQKPKSSPDFQQTLGYKSRTGNFKKALSRLLSQALIEMTNPQKPRDKNQHYRITRRGREILNKSN